MVSKISEGITVTVETFYQPEHSNQLLGDFMFAYRITLENHNDFAVRLLKRHWFIFDSNNTRREVEGEGVIGVQPVISASGKYQYMSGCNLNSEIGKMHGFYHMENFESKSTFLIHIPAFELLAPFKLN